MICNSINGGYTMMNKHISDEQLFWHLTEISNISSILENGLLSRSKIIEAGINIDDRAPENLTKDRKIRGLDKFVPFHFFPGNAYDIREFKNHKNKNFCYITIKRELANDHSKYKILLDYSNHNDIQLFEYNDKIERQIKERSQKTDYSDRINIIKTLGECLALDDVKPKNFYSIIVKTDKEKIDIENLSKKLFGKYNYIIIVKSGYFETL
jgi:hypothetical protein